MLCVYSYKKKVIWSRPDRKTVSRKKILLKVEIECGNCNYLKGSLLPYDKTVKIMIGYSHKLYKESIKPILHHSVRI